MRVWVTRDNGNKNRVTLTTKQPTKRGELFYSKEAAILMMFSDEIKKLFGFTPRKGSCKQYELTLKEIK